MLRITKIQNYDVPRCKSKRKILALSLLPVMFATAAYAGEASDNRADNGTTDSNKTPLVLKDQGSFYVGGRTIKGENGDTIHVEHSYIAFQKPVQQTGLPLVMWHGGGQTGKTWDSTPDGRDGYQQIFPKRGHSVYSIDQAGRGRGGRLAQGTTIPDATPSESGSWNIFRLGPWSPPAKRDFFPNTQFPKSINSINQYLEQTSVSTGPEPITREFRDLQSGNIAELFDKIGPGVLVTHSNSGQYGWPTAMLRPDLVKAVVAYEPGAFTFPEDSPPRDISTQDARVAAISAPQLVSAKEFKNLTKMPIVVIYGDNIEFHTPSPIFGVELWRVNVKRAKQFVEAVNQRGGDATLVFLPKIGIKGNTHFPFSDRNNQEVADHLSAFLAKHGLGKGKAMLANN